MNGLDMEIQFLPGVGPKRAELLSKELGVSTVGDLLRLYPFRYIDKSSIVRIADARPDMAYLQIRAKVLRVELYGAASAQVEAPGAGESAKEKAVKFNTIKRMSVWIGDGSGEMETVFFKGIKWMYEKLKPGAEFIFFGKPTAFNGRINIVHPEVDACPAAGSASSCGAAGSGALTGGTLTGGTLTGGALTGGALTGVYTSTEKLKNNGITGKIMTKIMTAAVEKGLPCMEETLPEYIMRQAGLVPLHFAIRNIHFPKDMASLEKAKYRLKFEELFFLLGKINDNISTALSANGTGIQAKIVTADCSPFFIGVIIIIGSALTICFIY